MSPVDEEEANGDGEADNDESQDGDQVVCVCKRIYSGEDGAIQKLLAGHLSLFRSIKIN
jgi:hypothetical protein